MKLSKVQGRYIIPGLRRFDMSHRVFGERAIHWAFARLLTANASGLLSERALATEHAWSLN
jgi:hypothetical protein